MVPCDHLAEASVYRGGNRVIEASPFAVPCGHGYNVHAGVVVGGHHEDGVERLCRYVCRPALAKSRIEEAPGGGVVLRFKRPWSDGTTGLRLTDLELVQRLAAQVPPPNANMLFYHGVFGPSAACRDEVVPTVPEPEPSRGRLTKRAQGRRGARTGRRWPWSDLLWHAPNEDSVGLLASDARAVGAKWWFAP